MKRIFSISCCNSKEDSRNERRVCVCVCLNVKSSRLVIACQQKCHSIFSPTRTRLWMQRRHIIQRMKWAQGGLVWLVRYNFGRCVQFIFLMFARTLCDNILWHPFSQPLLTLCDLFFYFVQFLNLKHTQKRILVFHFWIFAIAAKFQRQRHTEAQLFSVNYRTETMALFAWERRASNHPEREVEDASIGLSSSNCNRGVVSLLAFFKHNFVR